MDSNVAYALMKSDARTSLVYLKVVHSNVIAVATFGY